MKPYFKCAFYEKLTVGELLGEGKTFASCCPAHTTEHLPGSLHDAWRDRSGRLWWRSTGDIRWAGNPIQQANFPLGAHYFLARNGVRSKNEGTDGPAS